MRGRWRSEEGVLKEKCLQRHLKSGGKKMPGGEERREKGRKGVGMRGKSWGGEGKRRECARRKGMRLN